MEEKYRLYTAYYQNNEEEDNRGSYNYLSSSSSSNYNLIEGEGSNSNYTVEETSEEIYKYMNAEKKDTGYDVLDNYGISIEKNKTNILEEKNPEIASPSNIKSNYQQFSDLNSEFQRISALKDHNQKISQLSILIKNFHFNAKVKKPKQRYPKQNEKIKI